MMNIIDIAAVAGITKKHQLILAVALIPLPALIFTTTLKFRGGYCHLPTPLRNLRGHGRCGSWAPW